MVVRPPLVSSYRGRPGGDLGGETAPLNTALTDKVLTWPLLIQWCIIALVKLSATGAEIKVAHLLHEFIHLLAPAVGGRSPS